MSGRATDLPSSSRACSPLAVRIWIGAFAIWIALLSGAFGHWLGFFSENRLAPGILQAVRLNSLLNARREQLGVLQAELDKMGAEADRLEHSRLTQFREIRRTLGYAGQDELIFDFSSPDSI